VVVSKIELERFAESVGVVLGSWLMPAVGVNLSTVTTGRGSSARETDLGVQEAVKITITTKGAR